MCSAGFTIHVRVLTTRMSTMTTSFFPGVLIASCRPSAPPLSQAESGQAAAGAMVLQGNISARWVRWGAGKIPYIKNRRLTPAPRLSSRLPGTAFAEQKVKNRTFRRVRTLRVQPSRDQFRPSCEARAGRKGGDENAVEQNGCRQGCAGARRFPARSDN